MVSVQLYTSVVDPATGAHLTPTQLRLAQEMAQPDHDDGASCGGAAPCGVSPPCEFTAFIALEEFLRKSRKGRYDAVARADANSVPAPESSTQSVMLSDAGGLRGKPRVPKTQCDAPRDCMRLQPVSSNASTAATNDSQDGSRPSRRQRSQSLQLERPTCVDRRDAEGNAFRESDTPALDFPVSRQRTSSAPVSENSFASADLSARSRYSGSVVAGSHSRGRRPSQGSKSVDRDSSGRPGQGLRPPYFPRHLSSTDSNSSVSRSSEGALRSGASTAIPEDGSPRSRASTMTTVDEASPRASSRRKGSSLFEAAEIAKDQIASAHASRTSAAIAAANAAAEPEVEPWRKPLPSASELLTRADVASIKRDERQIRAILVRWTNSEVPSAFRLFQSLQGHAIEAKGTSTSRAFTDLELPDKRDLRLHLVIGGLPVEGGLLSVGVARRKLPGLVRVAPKGTPLGRVDDSMGMVIDAEGRCSLEAEDEIVEEGVCDDLTAGSVVDIHWRWTKRSLFFEVGRKEAGEITEVPEGPYVFAASLAAGCTVILRGAE